MVSSLPRLRRSARIRASRNHSGHYSPKKSRSSPRRPRGTPWGGPAKAAAKTWELGFPTCADHLVSLCDAASNLTTQMRSHSNSENSGKKQQPNRQPKKCRRSKKGGRREDLVFNLWNCCGLSYERLSYVKEDIGGDVTVLTELHMGDSSKWKWVEGDRLCVRSSAVSDSGKCGHKLGPPPSRPLSRSGSQPAKERVSLHS